MKTILHMDGRFGPGDCEEFQLAAITNRTVNLSQLRANFCNSILSVLFKYRTFVPGRGASPIVRQLDTAHRSGYVNGSRLYVQP